MRSPRISSYKSASRVLETLLSLNGSISATDCEKIYQSSPITFRTIPVQLKHDSRIPRFGCQLLQNPVCFKSCKLDSCLHLASKVVLLCVGALSLTQAHETKWLPGGCEVSQATAVCKAQFRNSNLPTIMQSNWNSASASSDGVCVYKPDNSPKNSEPRRYLRNYSLQSLGSTIVTRLKASSLEPSHLAHYAS